MPFDTKELIEQEKKKELQRIQAALSSLKRSSTTESSVLSDKIQPDDHVLIQMPSTNAKLIQLKPNTYAFIRKFSPR
jgi:hypothetical protein